MNFGPMKYINETLSRGGKLTLIFSLFPIVDWAKNFGSDNDQSATVKKGSK